MPLRRRRRRNISTVLRPRINPLIMVAVILLSPVLITAPAAQAQGSNSTMTVNKIEIPNAKAPADGVLTGGQPSKQALEQAKQQGYRTIVNLRPAGEFSDWDESAVVKQLGMEYVSIPVGSAADLKDTNIQRLDAVLKDKSKYPIIVHCASGNRVGALFALRAAKIEGKDAETALRIGREAGMTGLEAEVRSRLQP